MNIASLNNQSIVIAGAGATGQSVARFLDRRQIAWSMADERAGSDDSELLPMTAEVLTSADVVVLSPGIPRASAPVRAALDAGVTVIGDIELFASFVKCPVIAVTGSNGKSTVVAWVERTLRELGCKAVACGNIGLPALDVLDEAADVLVLELSSYQLESMCSLSPLVATVLNVSDDHLDRYDSIDQYAAVKRRVYGAASYRVFNLDDSRTMPEGAEGVSSAFTVSEQDERVFSDALEKSSSNIRSVYYVGELKRRSSGGSEVANNKVLFSSEESAPLFAVERLPLPGEHNIANALASLALIKPLIDAGIVETRLLDVAAALLCFPGLPHRTELVAERNGVRWYNDSKGTNVDASNKALLAMPGPVILIAGGIGKGAEFKALRSSVEKTVKALVLLGRDRALIAEALQDLAPVHRVDSLGEAVRLSDSLAEPGDVVLLSPACSSFDMFRNFEERGDSFRTLVVEGLAA